MHQPLFKLDQDPKGRGLRCDGDGLFFRGAALLQKNERGNFEARSDIDIRKILGVVDGIESRIRSVKLVADALNKHEMARAMMAAVLMRLPDPASPIRSPLTKAGYNPDEPRDERGRWTNVGYDSAETETKHRDPRIQLAGDFRSDASNDPMAVAAARAAAQAQHSSVAALPQARPRSSLLD